MFHIVFLRHASRNFLLPLIALMSLACVVDEFKTVGPDLSFTGDVATAMSDDSTGTDTDWLQDLPEGGVRMVFEHIHRFGAINEADATGMVGSPRKFRRFSQDFERYAERAPFEIRIDVSSGQKRYVREGG